MQNTIPSGLQFGSYSLNPDEILVKSSQWVETPKKRSNQPDVTETSTVALSDACFVH